MWLLVIAALGLLVPGGLFMVWLLSDYVSLSAAFSDKLALAFFLDLIGSTVFLAWLFARRPVGPIRWPWFLVLSLLTTLWFGLATYLWLNWRRLPKPRPGLASWWRSV